MTPVTVCVWNLQMPASDMTPVTICAWNLQILDPYLQNKHVQDREHHATLSPRTKWLMVHFTILTSSIWEWQPNICNFYGLIIHIFYRMHIYSRFWHLDIRGLPCLRIHVHVKSRTILSVSTDHSSSPWTNKQQFSGIAFHISSQCFSKTQN